MKTYKIIDRTSDGKIGLADESGKVFATIGREHATLAKQLALFPALVEALANVVDGAEGYICERGDGHPYWSPNAVEAARILLDRLGNK
jgi:hypothetical protein